MFPLKLFFLHDNNNGTINKKLFWGGFFWMGVGGLGGLESNKCPTSEKKNFSK